MKFFSTTQIREIDKYSIEHEPIASIDLMERAAQALYLELLSQVESDQPILIFAGPGNNGGDALALARMLLQSTLQVKVILLNTGKLSTNCNTNRLRLLEKFPDSLTEQINKFEIPVCENNSILVDGLFGSGLSGPLTGIYSEAVKWMNESGCKIYSIDIPSGLDGDAKLLHSIAIKAHKTFSFQFPKLAFLFAENAEFVGEWKILNIGIRTEAIEAVESNFYYLQESDIAPLLKNRNKFSHKGNFGHALIVAGSKGMAGASVLSAKAALRAGAGLVTVYGPECNRTIVQTAVPEVIFQSDINKNVISRVTEFAAYSTVALGPGIGTENTTAFMVDQFLKLYDKPCILDADALNCISQKKDVLRCLPKNSILTPHPKEFERLFGECNNSLKRMQKASEMAQKLGIIIVLKGAHTTIATPDGKIYFNSTGNSGMATAGSGDVLTGILAGLLAQGYSPEVTAKLGVFIHGRAGDLALNRESEESMMASDIIHHLGKAFNSLTVK